MGGSGHLTSRVVVRSGVHPQYRRYPNSHSCRVYDSGHLPYLDVSEWTAVSGYTAENKSIMIRCEINAQWESRYHNSFQRPGDNG